MSQWLSTVLSDAHNFEKPIVQFIATFAVRGQSVEFVSAGDGKLHPELSINRVSIEDERLERTSVFSLTRYSLEQLYRDGVYTDGPVTIRLIPVRSMLAKSIDAVKHAAAMAAAGPHATPILGIA